LKRKISLIVAATFSLTLALLTHGCGHSGASNDGKVNDTFKPDINETKLKDALGPDDGYSLAVLYGADIHGSLETCG
jgi:hypothetical protein